MQRMEDNAWHVLSPYNVDARMLCVQLIIDNVETVRDYATATGLDPSPLNLKLKPRIQEIILESKASHDGEDFTNEDLTGMIPGSPPPDICYIL